MDVLSGLVRFWFRIYNVPLGNDPRWQIVSVKKAVSAIIRSIRSVEQIYGRDKFYNSSGMKFQQNNFSATLARVAKIAKFF